MENFDLRKFLTENKLTSVARLRENQDFTHKLGAWLFNHLDQIQPHTNDPRENERLLNSIKDSLEKSGGNIPELPLSDDAYLKFSKQIEYLKNNPDGADTAAMEIVKFLEDINSYVDDHDYSRMFPKLREAGPIPPMPKDFLHGDTITFKYDGFERVPHNDDGGFVRYVSTERIGGYNLVIELGGEVTTNSQGYLVDFDYIFDYDESLTIDIVTAGLHKEGRVVRKKAPVKKNNSK